MSFRVARNFDAGPGRVNSPIYHGFPLVRSSSSKPLMACTAASKNHVWAISPCPLHAGTIASMTQHSDWFATLTQTLTLKDGTKLVTLADAHAYLIKHFKPETLSPRVGPGVLRAIELVMEAAETGSIADRSAATDQVEIVLRWRAY
jgi:hypothetical protein